MRTLYLLNWNYKTYVCTNGILMLDFANWLGATDAIKMAPDFDGYIPNIEKYG